MTTPILSAPAPGPSRTLHLHARDREWIEILRGGDRIRIRPLHADDMAMEKAFIEALSPEARRFRFLSSMASPDDALLRLLTRIDPETEVAYVALIDDRSRNQEIGVARFAAAPGAGECEFAVVVADRWQQKGIGTRLMGHLIEAARSRGLRKIFSNDAADNHRMRRFAEHLNLGHQADPQDPHQVIYSLELANPPRRAPQR
jgi:GNAT superfamily N-acetyltransferase